MRAAIGTDAATRAALSFEPTRKGVRATAHTGRRPVQQPRDNTGDRHVSGKRGAAVERPAHDLLEGDAGGGKVVPGIDRGAPFLGRPLDRELQVGEGDRRQAVSLARSNHPIAPSRRDPGLGPTLLTRV